MNVFDEVKVETAENIETTETNNINEGMENTMVRPEDARSIEENEVMIKGEGDSDLVACAMDISNSTITDGVASDYEIPGQETLPAYEYAQSRGRNQEFYKDPTYHGARKNYENRGYFTEEHPRDGEVHQSQGRYPYNVPVYQRRKSRRYETIGLIMRIADLAGFKLGDRIVLIDKETGEILK